MQIPSLLFYLNLSLSYSWSFPVPSPSAPCLFFNPAYFYPLPFFSLFFSFLLSKTHNSLSYRMLFLANLIPFRFHTYTDSPTSSLTSNPVSFLHFPLVFLVFIPFTLTLSSLFLCNRLHLSLASSGFLLVTFPNFSSVSLLLYISLTFLLFISPPWIPHHLFGVSPALSLLSLQQGACLFPSLSFRNVICSAAQTRSIIILLCPGGRERAGERRSGGKKGRRESKGHAKNEERKKWTEHPSLVSLFHSSNYIHVLAFIYSLSSVS